MSSPGIWAKDQRADVFLCVPEQGDLGLKLDI